MTDIRTVWDVAAARGDWLVEPPDLAHDRDLETAVLISLFTDRLAEPDDALPDPLDRDRRGWWGDTGPSPRDPIGSRLWLLAREKQTNDVRLRAEDYAREALAWMVEDGVADAVDVEASWTRLGMLEVAVTITRAGDRVFAGRYGSMWRAQADAV